MNVSVNRNMDSLQDSSPAWKISQLAPEHSDAFYSLILQQAAVHSTQIHDEAPNQGMALYTSIQADRQSEAFAVLHHETEEVLGGVTFYDCYTEEGHGIYLEDIVTDRNHRAQGVGKFAMAALAQVALERNACKMVWECADNNIPAHRFYDKLNCARHEDRHTQRIFSPIGQSDAFDSFSQLYTIRPVRPDDGQALDRLSAAEPHQPDFTWVRHAPENDTLLSAVVENKQGEILGLGLAYRNYSSFRICNGMHIEALHTAGDRSIAAGLMEHFGAIQKQRGWTGHTDITLPHDQEDFLGPLFNYYGFEPLAYADDRMITRSMDDKQMLSLVYEAGLQVSRTHTGLIRPAVHQPGIAPK